ncbi:unnamed protein product [Linum trigynum]|uniref:Acyl carrier protein n=1 Tax=Linum trigynum TaxID=586398 RepID=A0AAV2EVN7_9ROSI
MATFLASPTCPVAALPPSSSRTKSGNFTACFSIHGMQGGPTFVGLKHVPKFHFSPSVSSTSSRCFNATIACSAEAETLKVVQDTIAKQLSIEVTTVAPETKFADLGADSLDTVEIMMALEEQFSVSIGEGGAENIQTVQEAADLIEKVKNAAAA